MAKLKQRFGKLNPIEVSSLKKYYGEVKAVDDISFSVGDGAHATRPAIRTMQTIPSALATLLLNVFFSLIL